MQIKSENFPEKSELLTEGGFWVGDPCYILPDRDWPVFCEESFDYEENVALYDYDGENFIAWDTKNGDGDYSLKVDNSTVKRLSVDAGMISVIPMSLVKKFGATAGSLALGCIVKDISYLVLNSFSDGDISVTVYDSKDKNFVLSMKTS